MTDTRRLYDHVAGIYAPIALAVLAIVAGLVVVFAWRYRAGRPDRGAPDSRRSEAPRVEALYAVGLAAVAAVLVGVTLHTEGREDAGARRPALVVRATASQWLWRFTYPGGVTQIGAPATLVVPAGEVVRFVLTSRDVVHSFWIPARRFKRDAIPGRTTTFDLRFPDRPGVSIGECSEFCGYGHAGMRFEVRALPPARFRDWLARRGAAG